MTTDRAIVPIALENAAPPPLAPLTDVVISPANIAAEQRQRNAQRLSWQQRRKIKSDIRRLNKKLRSAQCREIAAVRASLKPQMERLHKQYTDLKQQIQQQPDCPALAEELNRLWQEIEPVKQRWDRVNQQARAIAPLYEQRSALLRALEDHQLSLARDKAEKRLIRAMRQEAEIYERLIIDKWTRLGYCYRYSKGSKDHVDKVEFAECSITLDAIYFKIDAAYQTAFKNWKTNVPQGVKVVEQLLDPSTLDELSLACQRQVTAVHGPAIGAWVIVHRLDSVDGLMNYVSFDDVMERYPVQHNHRMPICVGVAANRQVQWINLGDFPHWLIGGFTNSGKSNMVNVGICTLISHQKPDDLRLVLIDLKGGLEFSFYEGIPHLHGGIVDSVSKVADTLAELEAIMAERFKKFRAARSKRIEEFHARRPNDPMPRILCVFDEVASIMDHGDTTRRIASSLRQLTARGRAVGIHIWLCTQRPDVKVIEGAIKANLAVRISGRLPSSADSVTILGNSMAKDLAAVAGRMVLQLGPDPIAVQSPHITDQHIAESLKRAMTYQIPPALDVPEGVRVVHQEWTVERVIDLSIKHLGGNITWKKVYEAADDLSQSQARELVERIWNMPVIEHEGVSYQVKTGRSNTHWLKEIQPEPA